MKNSLLRLKLVFLGCMAAGLVFSSASVLALPLVAQTTFGSAGNEVGTGVAATGSGVYFTGIDGASSRGVLGQFSPSLVTPPVWSRLWAGPPTDPGQFRGVALTSTGVIAVGQSYYQTVDTVGGKEGKGTTVKFNSDGSDAGGPGGAAWTRQTPGAPGAFAYGGIEFLTGVTTAPESGQTRIYVAGLGQTFGPGSLRGNLGRFVAKLDDSGNILWSRSDATTFVNAPGSELWGTRTTGIVATGDYLFMASRKEDGGVHPDLKKYDSNGSLLWTRNSGASGEYRAVTSANGTVYAVGQTDPDSANTDFLIESWDGSGNLLWSKSYDRNSAEDTLHGVVIDRGRLFAVGSTTGGTAGGADGVVLEIDALTGNLIDSTLWGGTNDDSFSSLAILGSTLFAVGSTQSFGAGGSDIAIASFALPADGVPEPATLLLTAPATAWLLLARRRTLRFPQAGGSATQERLMTERVV